MPDMEAVQTARGRQRRKARVQCRQDHHRFGSAHVVGAGITRRVCGACGSVSIDLTEAEEPLVHNLFQDRLPALDLAR